jgi:glycosyltransferase involved in cell wall biosynthesis
MSRNLHRRLTEELGAFVSRPLFDESVILKKDPTYPKISIVTPSYNQGDFLETTILSVLNQNYPNLEFIIMDGGSTDNSVAVIKKYEKYLDYWTSEKDRGQSDAINKGFLKSTGTILAHLNSDDVYCPGALLKAASFFRTHPGVDVLYGDTYLIDENGDIFRVLKDVRAFRSSLMFGAVYLVQPNAFWTRDIFFKAGMLDTKYHYCMDVAFWSQILRLGGKFFHVPEPVACYRLHPSSKMADKKECDRAATEMMNKRLNGQYKKFSYYLFYYLCQFRRVILYFLQGDACYFLMRAWDKLGRFVHYLGRKM